MSAEPAGSDGFVWRPAVFAPIDWQSTSPTEGFENFVDWSGHGVDAYNLIAHGEPPLPFSDLWNLFSGNVGKTLGAAFGVFGYLINPEQTGCEPSMETCAGYLPPAAQSYLFSNVNVLSPVPPGIFGAPPQNSNVLLQFPQQNSDFDVFDLSNYQ
jgi:hypothetical protein